MLLVLIGLVSALGRRLSFSSTYRRLSSIAKMAQLVIYVCWVWCLCVLGDVWSLVSRVIDPNRTSWSGFGWSVFGGFDQLNKTISFTCNTIDGDRKFEEFNN